MANKNTVKTENRNWHEVPECDDTGKPCPTNLDTCSNCKFMELVDPDDTTAEAEMVCFLMGLDATYPYHTCDAFKRNSQPRQRN